MSGGIFDFIKLNLLEYYRYNLMIKKNSNRKVKEIKKYVCEKKKKMIYT